MTELFFKNKTKLILQIQKKLESPTRLRELSSELRPELRFKFRKLPLFKAIDVPCNSKTMGKDLLQLIRFNEIKSGIISNLSSTNITKMLSLCANV